LAVNPFLVVSIARDKNVLKIKKAKPTFSENERMFFVENCKFTDKVILSGIKNHIPHIVKEKPDIIALGYDQFVDLKALRGVVALTSFFCKIKRLKSYQPEKYKSSLFRDGKK